jgi:hypothetical protein
MTNNVCKIAMLLLFLLSAFAEVDGQNQSTVIKDIAASFFVDANELKNLNFDLPTGGLKVAAGLET